MKKQVLAAVAAVCSLGLLLTGCTNSGDAGNSSSASTLKVVGKPFTTEKYGVGLPKDTPYCQQVNDAIKSMIDDGTWKSKLDSEMQGVDYTPNAQTNPPKDFETCGPAGDAKLVKDGRLTIGIKFDQPKLGYQDGNTYTGFDVDVATYIAGKLGFSPDQIDWVQAVSSQRETLLENHQVDMIVATYSITDSRKEKVQFAGPYFIAGQDLLIRSDETNITGPESLTGQMRLCSVTGSTPAQNIKDNYASDVQLIEYNTYSECVNALKNDKVDAVTTDDIILAGLAASSK
jgi:ABC-type amino acid transport substrate-binding protein